MTHDDEITALVQTFHDAGKRLAAHPKASDQEMAAIDEARVHRLESLQELVDRTALDGAARLLGMATKDVEDELRFDTAIE